MQVFYRYTCALVKYVSRYECSLDDLRALLDSLVRTDHWLLRTCPEQFALDPLIGSFCSALEAAADDDDETLKRRYRTRN